jgi:hypothetical protein
MDCENLGAEDKLSSNQPTTVVHPPAQWYSSLLMNKILLKRFVESIIFQTQNLMPKC